MPDGGMTILLTVLSGALVGLVLGLIGGGGSILAVPLLVTVAGLPPHVAIGTSAVAVTASAVFSLAHHARAQRVKWPCAIAFALAGSAGAAGGAAFGKQIDGTLLLALFGGLMIAVGIVMTMARKSGGDPDVRLTLESAPRLLPLLAGIGFVVGLLSGFFGIGGGFLIVPGLVGATAMPLLNAVASSLLSVTAFGATTAASYAADGLVDWSVAGWFVLGGAGGGAVGVMLAGKLAAKRQMLGLLFAAVVIATGLYLIARATLGTA